MAKTPRIHDLEKTVFGNKVKTDFIDAPFTTIKNEQGTARTIPDLENNLKVSMGVERVMFNSIKKLDKEFGPSGEVVHELSTKDARVRFVGNGWYQINDNTGSRSITTDVDDFLEVTFYGTGINLLSLIVTSSWDLRYSVDGGVESSDFLPSGSNVLQTRNYKTNQVIPMISGLSLGIHTVKVRLVSGDFQTYGCEILNENASAQLTVNAGEPFVGGLSATLDTQQIIDAGPSSYSGVKGARVVTYLDEEGNLGQAITEVDPSVTTGDPTELVTNGTFNTDLTGWSNLARATWHSSGRLLIDATTGSGGRQAEQGVATTIGQKYTVSVDYETIATSGSLNTQQVDVYEGPNYTGAKIAGTLNESGSGTLTLTFTATTTTSYIVLTLSDNGDSSYYDNVSCKETAYNFLALSDTDHSEEEIIRTINFREFGANRADDFSTLTSSSDRAFTLDDGTTTLVGNDVRGNSTPDGLFGDTTGDWFTITFVGTGLDVIARDSKTSVRFTEVTIDGTVVGNILDSDFNTSNVYQNIKVCSGLPYGTHTVKFEAIAGDVGLSTSIVSDFIFYGPKKPALPDNTFELADYNVLADYETLTSSNSDVKEEMTTGVVRKSSDREAVYVGAGWTSNGVVDLNHIGAFDIQTANSTEYVERSFYGTGFEWRVWAQTGGAATGQTLVSIDGSTDLSSFTTSVIGSEVSITPATGIYDATVTVNGVRGLSVSGLPLGWHTVRFTKQSGVRMYAGVIDIITPIHVNNTKVGSLSLEDKREDQQRETDAKNIDMGKAKAWFIWDTSGEILDSYNISSIFDPLGTDETLRFYFKKPFKRNPVGVVSTSGTFSPYLRIAGIDNQVTSPIDSSGGFIQNANMLAQNIIMAVFYGELENEEDIDLDEL